MLIGVAVVAIAGLTGSRMSSAVLTVLLLCSPSLAVSLQWRVAALLAVLVLLQISQTEAFKTRFFFLGRHPGRRADPQSQAGHRRTQGGLAGADKGLFDAPITGHGVGASAQIGENLPGHGFGQPHNDYPRAYCDTGLAGTILFWGFFLAAGVRSAWLAIRGTDRQLHAAPACSCWRSILFALTDNPMGLHRPLHDPACDRPRIVGRHLPAETGATHPPGP